jgi:DNA-binding FadR family transcriptional regulator
VKTYTREVSWDFHALLAQAAHNGAVEGLAQSFRSSLSLHPIRTREGAAAHARTVEEHDRILRAIEKRDAHAARREMAHHLMRGTQLVDREAELLALWDARGGQAPRRRAK